MTLASLTAFAVLQSGTLLVPVPVASRPDDPPVPLHVESPAPHVAPENRTVADVGRGLFVAGCLGGAVGLTTLGAGALVSAVSPRDASGWNRAESVGAVTAAASAVVFIVGAVMAAEGTSRVEVKARAHAKPRYWAGEF